jgi:lambda family phage portal protein
MSASHKAGVRYRIKGTGVYVSPVASTSSLGAGDLTGGESQPYEAAGSGRRATTWRSPGVGPNAALSYSQGNLVNRSRDAVRKNPLADQAVSVWEANVIGTGIKPQWKTSDPGVNRELGELFEDWTDEADADDRLDFYGCQGLAVRAMVEAGEVFTRLRTRRPEDMASVPLQVQLLESEFCPLDEFRLPSRSGNTVMQGIEIDQLGRRAGYWMYRQHPNDWLARNGAFDALPHFVPAGEIAHICQVRRPGQLRGEPWLSRALIKLRDLDKYDDAELMRKQVAALIAGFITRDKDDENFAGEGEPDSNGMADVSWEPGTMQMLRPGQDVTFSTPTEVGGTYEVFLREQKRTLAVAAGIMYEQLTGDYSKVNDRTYRASVNEFHRRAEAVQHTLVVRQFCRPIILRWIDITMLARSIRLPRGMELRELRRVDWIPQGWSYINPVQEVQAEIAAIRGGITSRSSAVSKRGGSAEEVDRQTAEDNARADELGLVHDSDPRKVSGAGLTQARTPGSRLPEVNPAELDPDAEPQEGDEGEEPADEREEDRQDD